MSAPQNFGDRPGEDAVSISRWLMLFELGEADHAIAELLVRRVIQPHVGEIENAFYNYLGSHAEFERNLGSADKRKSLRRSQRRYLLSLGVDFDSPAYFSDRAAVGQTHARIGLPLELYQCAYQKMSQLIGLAIDQEFHRDESDNRILHSFLRKIIFLDMSLAVDAYHGTQMGSLKQVVETLRAEDQRLRLRIDTDELTQVGSLHYLNSVLPRTVNAARIRSQPLCIIMADVDRFKRINDQYGHQMGDRVLQAIAIRIQQAVRERDLVARYGGEEFVIVLWGSPLSRGRKIAERVRRLVADRPISVDGRLIKVTVSQGLALLQDDDSPDSLIARADKAMYEAKAAGRNCVRVAENAGD